MYKYNEDLGVLVGKILTDCRQEGNEELIFITDDGSNFVLGHQRDCCESVYIEDICGDLTDLVGSPIVIAEEVYSEETLPPVNEGAESFTWTFYKFATAKGYVTVRFYGESNGYYSESVEFCKTI